MSGSSSSWGVVAPRRLHADVDCGLGHATGSAAHVDARRSAEAFPIPDSGSGSEVYRQLRRGVPNYETALKPLHIRFFMPYQGEDGHPDLWGFGDGKKAFFWKSGL
jgi:hypothetical protein